MSTPTNSGADLLAKLPAQLQTLVQSASSKLPADAAFGASEAETKEIGEWVSIASGLSSQAQLEVSLKTLGAVPAVIDILHIDLIGDELKTRDEDLSSWFVPQRGRCCSLWRITPDRCTCLQLGWSTIET